MADHYTIPSFAARNQSKANTYTLKYNPDTQKYSLTIEDTNNTLSNIKFSASGISVSRSGNKYTFTSDKMITSPVTVSAQKQVNLNTDDMLIWGCVGKQTMISGASDPVYFYFKIDTETYGTGHIKKTSEDGVVSGIKFNISGNGVNKTVTTKADGTVDIQLMPGIYTVAEQSIDRYEPQSVQRVTIVSGHTSTVTFNNTLKRGDLEIIKNSEDNLVEGVKFHLYGTSLSGLPVDEYAVTDAKGVAKFSNVLISGDTPYVVEEIDTAVRYVVPASQTAPIEWEKVTSRTFVNVLKKFNVTVTKSDVETGTEQGDASLAGAVYVIYKGEELIDTYTTDGNGQFTSKYYICGDDWTVRELTPSEGYLLDPTIHKVGAEPELYTVEYNSTANDVTEQVIKGNIAIIKHTDDGKTQIETPEVGATFEVYLKSAGSFENAKETERDVLTCDENGFAQTKDMPYGIYTVHQTSGWEGRELMKDFDVFISADGQTYRYLINNANFESYIKIVKKDAETGNTIPYAGAGFQIYDPNGNLVTMTFTYPEVTTIDTFYTTEDGYLITPQTLEYGTGYSLVEVQAPYGYVLNSEPVYFDVAQDNSTEESGITVIEVVRSNMAQKGTITVSKSGEVFSSVSENNGLYQPIFAVSGLEGAVYEITAAEDIYTLDGTLRASKGEVVDTVTTGADGTAKSKELYLGKYEVKEITAPFGMVLNDEIHSVELVYAGQNVAVTKTATSFYNERQRVEIDLTKSLETDEAYGIGKNGEIFDVTFGLYAQKDITAADGTVIPADGLIEIISFDENGYGKVATDLPFGSYYVREISTNSAYIISDQKYPVTFEYQGQDTATVHITANDGEAIENNIIYGSVSGKKSDEDGKALGGAVIGIFKAGTEEFTKENAIQTTTSKDDGSFSFAKVPYGTWIIREIESPKGFVLSEEEIAVTIGKVDEVVEIELVNYFIQGNIELTKVDKDYPDNKLSGAVFEVFADTNKNGEFDKDDELLGEMAELDGGVYQMKELRYGKYFVREKTAPTGFVLDEKVYTVSIEEDGKTYVVENEAGKGFVNAAQTGSLKIVKTSSDGKLEGFSFRVTGTDYDKTFKTDKNGEIFIENLRIGEYTVSEVNDKASAGYILPADKQATVKVGATTIVQMHNEFRDTPKTGDDFNPALWVSLAVISLAGAGVLGFIGFKNRKKKED
ncbi:collagen adhesion protein [Eubacterium sp. CAG:603]|nr:collagen adhesion protein [Eubacterium sp. CAG:603]